MDGFRYFVALAMVVALPPPFLVWLLIHPFADKWRRVGPWGTYLAVSGFILLGMAAIWSVREPLLAIQFGFSAPLMVPAVVLLGMAIYLRARWRRVLLPSTLIGLPEISGRRAPGELVTAGIYSHIRHPRYVQVGLVVGAAAFFSNYLAAYILGLAYVPLAHLIVRFEERELENRFGTAYEEYCLKVPRFIPHIQSPRTGSDRES